MTEQGSPTNRDDDSSTPVVPEALGSAPDSAEVDPAGHPVVPDQAARGSVDPSEPVPHSGGQEWASRDVPPSQLGDAAQWSVAENSSIPAPGYGVPSQSPQPGTPGYAAAQYPAQPMGTGYGQPLAQGANEYPGYGVYPGSAVSPKTKVAGAILAFFLGVFGAHNFYFGKKGRAIAQLVATLVGLALMVFGVVLFAAGVDAVEAYNSYGYRVYEDDDTLLGAGVVVLIVAFLMLCATSIWAFVEFILVLVGSGGYARDKEGRIIQ